MSDSYRDDPCPFPLTTTLAIYLGHGCSLSFTLVCEGVSQEERGSLRQRAFRAFEQRRPRGPYPVSNRFTIYVHELVESAPAGERVLRMVYIDVTCDTHRTRAVVSTKQSNRSIEGMFYVIGDDVVTVARRVLDAAFDE